MSGQGGSCTLRRGDYPMVAIGSRGLRTKHGIHGGAACSTTLLYNMCFESSLLLHRGKHKTFVHVEDAGIDLGTKHMKLL